MANIVITNVDNASIELEGGQHRDETLRFDAADTFVKGTILARRAVLAAVTASAVTGTGNGTVTAAAVAAGPETPIPGAYVLTCTAVVTHGGVFKLVDPNGKIVGTGLAMTAGSGGATIVEVAGLIFTINDGSTDFIVGDFFTLTVTADGSLVPFTPVGSRGDQYPVAVLTYEVTKSGSGTMAIRALVAGVVNKNRLVIDDASSITNAILDQLRGRGITPIDVQQLAALDNQ